MNLVRVIDGSPHAEPRADFKFLFEAELCADIFNGHRMADALDMLQRKVAIAVGARNREWPTEPYELHVALAQVMQRKYSNPHFRPTPGTIAADLERAVRALEELLEIEVDLDGDDS